MYSLQSLYSSTVTSCSSTLLCVVAQHCCTGKLQTKPLHLDSFETCTTLWTGSILCFLHHSCCDIFLLLTPCQRDTLLMLHASLPGMLAIHCRETQVFLPLLCLACVGAPLPQSLLCWVSTLVQRSRPYTLCSCWTPWDPSCESFRALNVQYSCKTCGVWCDAWPPQLGSCGLLLTLNRHLMVSLNAHASCMCAWHSCRAAVHVTPKQHMKRSLFLTLMAPFQKAPCWLVYVCTHPHLVGNGRLLCANSALILTVPHLGAWSTLSLFWGRAQWVLSG